MDVYPDTPGVDEEFSQNLRTRVEQSGNFAAGCAIWVSSVLIQSVVVGVTQAWVNHWEALKVLCLFYYQEHQQNQQIDRVLSDAITEAANSPDFIETTRNANLEEQQPVMNFVEQIDLGTQEASTQDLNERAVAGVDSEAAVEQVVIQADPRIQGLDTILEADGTPVAHHVDLAFSNWGLTVNNTPAVTFTPRSRTGIQSIVRWAGSNGKKVRASGYRHTWTNMFSQNHEVLISMLPLEQAAAIPQLHPIPINPNQDLAYIQIVDTVVENGVEIAAFCKIGASTTNDQFRMWCLNQGEHGGQLRWTVPLNVIMVEITWGGSNAPICHGARLRHQTLSDLVTEVEFVNFHGEIQVVNDPQQLRAAAGAFGLMGIVTAITLKLDRMTYAAMRPRKISTVLAVPPPDLDLRQVPPELNPGPITPEALENGLEEFTTACANNYYSEWFWFPYQDKCWVNCWNNDGHEEDARVAPQYQAYLQGLEGFFGQIFNRIFGNYFPSFQTWVMSWSAMAVLPDIGPNQRPAVTPLIEALHFRRGIQNMRVLDMELEIPIPPLANGGPDWSVCQKAWWAVINRAYQYRNRGQYPLRIALEMRIMGDSNILMAPQYGNKLGTCSIEILRTPQTDPNLWNQFMQEVSNDWMGYTGPDGDRLKTRPHWSKQWQGLTINNMPAQEYHRTVSYRDTIPQFREQLAAIAAAGRYTIDDMKTRFGNPLLEYLFFPQH